MFRSLKHAWAKRQAHRRAQAEARCHRLISACSNTAQLAVMAWAAGHYRDPLRRERVMADLATAFNHLPITHGA